LEKTDRLQRVDRSRSSMSEIGHQLTLADANWVSASDPLR
jgi:hypothetical protein